MADLTHTGFRTLVEHFGGCDLYFSEMISVGALVSCAKYEKFYVNPSPVPRKTIFQLIGGNPEYFIEAVELLKHDPHLVENPVAGYDINMGCGAPGIKVLGGGIYLRKETAKIKQIIESLRKILPDQTLSIKIRIGDELTDSNNKNLEKENLLTFCRMACDSGVDFITLHPRYSDERFRRTARWEFVQYLKEKTSIPIIGCGDVTDYSAYQNKTRFNPSAIMIGRAAIRMPWIFRMIKEFDSDSKEFTVDLYDTYKRFVENLRIYQHEDFWPSRLKKFSVYFFYNLAFGNYLKNQIYHLRDFNEIDGIIRQYFEDNRPEQVKTFKNS